MNILLLCVINTYVYYSLILYLRTNNQQTLAFTDRNNNRFDKLCYTLSHFNLVC